jgi:hypothetical protein
MSEIGRVTLMAVEKVVDLVGAAKEFADLHCHASGDQRRLFEIALVSLLINTYEGGVDTGRRERLSQTGEHEEEGGEDEEC